MRCVDFFLFIFMERGAAVIPGGTEGSKTKRTKKTGKRRRLMGRSGCKLFCFLFFSAGLSRSDWNVLRGQDRSGLGSHTRRISWFRMRLTAKWQSLFGCVCDFDWLGGLSWEFSQC